MKDDIKYYWDLFKSGTKLMFKEFFNKDTNKKQRANMWTFTRLVIPVVTVILSIIAISTNLIPLFIVSGAIAGFGAVTDYFDGKSSRKHNSTSEYGRLLDQTSDKVFAGIIGTNLLFLNPAYISVLLGETLIATTNIGYKVKHKDLKINSTKAGKIKEWPLFISLALGYLSTINPAFLTISNISIILTNVFQAVTVASYIKSNNKEIKELEQENKEIEPINLTIEEESENEKVLQLEKSNKSNTNNTSKKLELYRTFKEELNQIIENKEEKESNQKQYTLKND